MGKKIFFVSFLLVAVAGTAAFLFVHNIGHVKAQSGPSDPLNSAYMPAIDTNAADYPSNIWMTDSLAKVPQDSGSPGPNHWITVYSTKNEIQSFQVHVHAGAAPINNLNVTVSDLVNAQTGTHISAASTDIVVYREAYEDVTIPTANGTTFLNVTGHLPDILIPAIDPYYHQTTDAFPYTVAAGNNQSVWVDVHVPANAPSGYYSGTVTVSGNGGVLTTMPVVYAVWDWTMPSTASLPSFANIGYGGLCDQSYGLASSSAGCANYPGAEDDADFGVTWTQVDAAVQLLDNRYSLGNITNVFPGAGSFATFDSVYGPLLGGTSGGHVAGILQGAKLTSWSLALLGGQFTQATFQNFQNNFAQNGWVTPWISLADEPASTAQWDQIVTTGNEVHSFGTDIPTGVTADLPAAEANNAQNAVDRLIVNIVGLEPSGPGATGLQPLSTYQEWLGAPPAGGPARGFWSYLSCSSVGTCSNGVSGSVQASLGYPDTYPNYDIDGTAVANRVMEWLTYLHGQQGELYYNVDVCDYPLGVSTLCGVNQPGLAASPLNPLVSDYYSGGWGDGTLLYPGTPSYAGVTIPIWLPSMRLKDIRDGMQDYEYLHALTQAGYGSLATTEADSFITNSYTFNNDPTALQAARMALGNKLHQLALAGALPTQPAPPAPTSTPPIVVNPPIVQTSTPPVQTTNGITLVQHMATHGLSIAFPNSVTAGDLIVVSFSGDQGNYPISSISDTHGDKFQKAVSCSASGGVSAEIWYASNVGGGRDAVTISAPGGGSVGIAEFSGVATSNSLDVAKCNTSAVAPTYSTGNVTTNNNGDLLYGAIADGGGLPSAGAGYSLLDSVEFNWEFGHEYAIAGTAGAYNATFGGQGTRNDGAILLAAFAPVNTGSQTTSTSTLTAFPMTSIVSPASNATVAGTVSISATASDNAGVTEVQFYIDGSLIGTDTTSPYNFSLNTATLPNGFHTLMTKAYDAAGNIGISPNVVITISNSTGTSGSGSGGGAGSPPTSAPGGSTPGGSISSTPPPSGSTSSGSGGSTECSAAIQATLQQAEVVVTDNLSLLSKVSNTSAAVSLSAALSALNQAISSLTAEAGCGGATATQLSGAGAAPGSNVSFPAVIMVTAPSLKVRSQPSTSAPLAGSKILQKGNEFKATNEVVGQSVSGNDLWWVSASGHYVWSGGTTVVSSQ